MIACNPYHWIPSLYSIDTQQQYANALVWKQQQQQQQKQEPRTMKIASSSNSTPPVSRSFFSFQRNPITTTTTTTGTTETSESPSSSSLSSSTLSSLLEPHIYEVSSRAYRGLATEGMDQAILVSGESGAGKTQSVKLCMQHIATLRRQQEQEEVVDPKIVQRVLDSNPLLEAFGNAQTSRNDNSSRFAKYTKLQFQIGDPVSSVHVGHRMPLCTLVGSQSHVYMLEKSRIVHHQHHHTNNNKNNNQERTFHIFYQLLSSSSSMSAEDQEIDRIKKEIWPKLETAGPQSFAYVGATEVDTIEGITDRQHFANTLQSLALMGITTEKRTTLFRALCMVLQLGNLVVEPDPNDPEQQRSRIQPTSRPDLNELANFLGVNVTRLESAILIRTMKARNEEFKVPLKVNQAKESCDALAKEIYAQTFQWLVHQINQATSAETSTDHYSSSSNNNNNNNKNNDSSRLGTIALLDITGFESFETNCFEQLCFNYANEKLQKKFTEDVFVSIQHEYKAEGVELDQINYPDNTSVLDLVEGNLGLLALLNEECLRPGGSDQAYVTKILSIHQQKAAAKKDGTDKAGCCLFREKRFGKHEFGIKHYAHNVVYTSHGFVSQNKDLLPTALRDCALASTNEIVSQQHLRTEDNDGEVVEEDREQAPEMRSSVSSKKKSLMMIQKQSDLVQQTVWTKFKTQLNELMETLSRTHTRYIRCIKPNSMKRPLTMQHKLTLEQLRCVGVV